MNPKSQHTLVKWTAASTYNGRTLCPAQLLLDHGADVDARDTSGNSPLHMAAREGDWTCVDCLIRVGADPDLRNSMGRTALELACTFAEDEPAGTHALRTAMAARGTVKRVTDSTLCAVRACVGAGVGWVVRGW